MMLRQRLYSLLIFRFFAALRRKHPRLFILFILATFVQLAITPVKISVTPFLLYGMFSAKEKVSQQFIKKEIFLDSIPLSTLRTSGLEKQLLIGTLDHYMAIRKNDGVDIAKTHLEKSRFSRLTNSRFYSYIEPCIYNDSTNLRRFEQWMKQKLGKTAGRDIDSIYVVEYSYTFNETRSSLKLLSREKIASF